MLILSNGTLIDGTGREPIKKAVIVINGNRFENLGSGIEYPKNANVIDLQNFTIIPGLIDCHLHLGGLTVDKPGKAIGKVSLIDMASFFLDYLRNYAHRRQLAIENGVTTIRSAGDHYPHIIRLRDKIAAGKLSGPRIFAPGPTITAPGGHPAGTIYKGNRYIIENAVRQIADVNNAREEVSRLAEGGVDCIKAIYSDIDPMNINHKVPKISLGQSVRISLTTQILQIAGGTSKMQYDEIINKLKALSNPKAVEGMARFGINPENTYGVSIPNLRRMAKDIGVNHTLAQQLWGSGVHEARILASMVDNPEMVTEEQIERWVMDFDSWDVCDQCCMNMLEKTKFAYQKAVAWSSNDNEFTKRAGFVLMARLAVSDKKAGNQQFGQFLPLIKREAGDNRNFVKKAVNWALRQIGKRNLNLNRRAIKAAEEIQGMEFTSAKWIASNAIRELTSQAVQQRLQG